MDELKATWVWIYRAPMPAVLGLVMFLTAWVVYTQDSLRSEQLQIRASQTILIASDTEIRSILRTQSDKLDVVVAAVLESKAQLKADAAARSKGGR